MPDWLANWAPGWTFLLAVLSLLSFGIWLRLAAGRYDFWKANQRLPTETADIMSWPAVVAVIPARNEADVIRRTLASVVAQEYPGDFTVVLADDNSTDGTARAALEVAETVPIDVIKVPPLPNGWTGKLWALSHGITHAEKALPEHAFVWLTDADILHDRWVLKRLVAKAEDDHRGLVSLMVKLHCQTFWEGQLVPAFVFFFQMLYPFPAINRDMGNYAGAAGGCILVRRQCLDDIGGIGAIRGELIDDCALAARVREAGGLLWLGLTDASRSVRTYNFGDLWQMVSRTAFTQLCFSSQRLLGTVIGMILMFAVPVALVLGASLHGSYIALWFSGVTWMLIIAIYAPTLGFYGRSLLNGFSLPFVALLYVAMTVDSAIKHWQGKGTTWKSRTYGG